MSIPTNPKLVRPETDQLNSKRINQYNCLCYVETLITFPKLL